MKKMIILLLLLFCFTFGARAEETVLEALPESEVLPDSPPEVPEVVPEELAEDKNSAEEETEVGDEAGFEEEEPEETGEVEEEPEDPEIPEEPPEVPVDEEEQTEAEEVVEEEPEVPVPTPRILINELFPNPESEESENEFIELFNAGDAPADLLGWKLDDSNQEDGKFYVFEEGAILMPGDYLVLYRPETGITLNNSDDGVFLYDATEDETDAYFYETIKEGRTWGRDSDSLEWRVFKYPTPGEVNVYSNAAPTAVIDLQGDTRYMDLNVTGANSFDPDGDTLTYLWAFEEGSTDTRKNPLKYSYLTPGEKTLTLTVSDPDGLFGLAEISFFAEARQVSGGGGGGGIPKQNYPFYSLINEFIPNPAGNDTEGEWIELYNSSSQSIDLGGWYLDDDEGGSRPYKIPDNIVLPSHRAHVFYATDLKLSLKNSEDRVRLLDPNKEEKESIFYSGVQENFSYAKKPDGTFEWTSLLSPWEENRFPAPPRFYPEEALVFDRVLANPNGKDNGKEKIIFKNPGTETVDVMGWMLEDGQGHTAILESFVVPPGVDYVLEQEHFKFSLNNGEEFLFLRDGTGHLIDEIHWKNAPSGQWLFNLDSLQDGQMAEVLRVVDGDTLVLSWQGRSMKVRLLGVDTPETVHPFKPVEFYGKKASAYSKNLMEGKTIRLEFDQQKIDKYGRLLAYIYVDDLFVNAELVRQGFAFAYTRFPFKYLDDFVAYEKEAKEEKRGMWQNLKVRDLLEKAQALGLEEEVEEPLELLALEELEELAEETEEGEEETETAESEFEPQPELVPCPSTGLEIDSFFPNPQTGEGVEWIRLVNTGLETVCLRGWSLDDIVEGGSKPFVIRGGGMASGAVRTFRKNETKLALNNKDDCVTLIAPDGTQADQICYGLTHKKETFTRAGGDWKPKPRAKKTSTASSSKTLASARREVTEYQWDLVTDTLIGTIREVDETDQVLYVELENKTLIPVFYAGSQVNIAAFKQLLDFSQPFEVKIRGETEKQLVAIAPLNAAHVAESGDSSPLPLGEFLFFLVSVFCLLFFRHRLRD